MKRMFKGLFQVPHQIKECLCLSVKASLPSSLLKQGSSAKRSVVVTLWLRDNNALKKKGKERKEKEMQSKSILTPVYYY